MKFYSGGMRYDGLSDETLVEMIGRRDSGAFSTLYDRYAPQTLAVAMIVTHDRRAAETAVEQVFYDLWRRRGVPLIVGTSVRNSLMLSTRRLAERLPQPQPQVYDPFAPEVA